MDMPTGEQAPVANRSRLRRSRMKAKKFRRGDMHYLKISVYILPSMAGVCFKFMDCKAIALPICNPEGLPYQAPEPLE